MGNMKQPVQNHGEQSQPGIPQKHPRPDQVQGKKANTQGQRTVAGSTGTGNQGKAGNPVSGK